MTSGESTSALAASSIGNCPAPNALLAKSRRRRSAASIKALSSADARSPERCDRSASRPSGPEHTTGLRFHCHLRRVPTQGLALAGVSHRSRNSDQSRGPAPGSLLEPPASSRCSGDVRGFRRPGWASHSKRRSNASERWSLPSGKISKCVRMPCALSWRLCRCFDLSSRFALSGISGPTQPAILKSSSGSISRQSCRTA